jgi:hypothetical protein
MTDRRPEPGSPWARYCADAWPREWLARSGGQLPPGFTRAAEPVEADLIVGRITEVAYLLDTGLQKCTQMNTLPGATETSSPPPRRRNPVVLKVLGYREFFDRLPDLVRSLSPGAIALWCWLWTCERKGLARCSVRRLGRRFNVSPSTAGRWLGELIKARFVRVVRRGTTNRSATVVRIRPRPHSPEPTIRGAVKSAKKR